MKTANTRPLARPLHNRREEGAGTRLSRTVSRIALAAMLLLAAPLALAQVFPPSLSNTASISPPSGVTNSGASCTGAGRSFSAGVCSSTDTNTLAASSDLAISKTGTATVNQGGTVTYTIRVWNNGLSSSLGATIADTVPANLTSVSWTCAGTGAGSTCSAASGTGNNISLTANLPVDTGATTTPDTAFVTVTVTGTATTPGAIANTATVAAPAGATDPTPGNNSSTANTTITALTDLAISKTGTATVNQGGAVSYTIRVWNNGPGAATGAAITDTVPANLTSVSWTCAGTGAGSTCSAASGTGNSISLTANLPVDTGAATSADTSFVTITVTGTATTPGAITNTATVAAPAGASDPTPGNNSSAANTTITALNDLAINKTGTASANQGGAVSYTIRVWNNGPSAVTGASITDTVPANLTSVSWTCAGTGAGSTCSAASGTGNSISLTANLPVDTGAATSADTSFVTITVTGTATTPGAITNTANVAAPAGTSDPTAGNNSSTANTTIVALADLAITKGVSNSAPIVGTNVTFTLTVTNNGPSAAAAVSVADLLPAGYTYVSDNGAGAYVSGTGVWTIGSLANGASVSLQIVATVRATGPYANTATVSSTTTDPTPGNNTSTSTPTPVASADLSIVKGVSNSTPAVGTNVTFTLTVTNSGPSAAAAVSVADLLPAGYTYVSDNGAGAYVPGTGAWTVGSLANGASTSLQIVATVRATGPYANTATVSSTTNDPTPGNNTSTSTPTPVASADLSIVKGVSNSAPAVGTNVTFTLTVTNNGPSAAAAVSVADLLPAGYTYVSDNGAGAYVPGTGAWTIGSLANGASTSLQIVATVRATGPYANTATVSSTTTDPTPGNNTSTSTPVPVVSSDLSIVKGVSNSTPAVGTNVTFTLTVTNNGPSPATGVSVADLLPNGYTYVSDNGAGAYVSGTGVWTIGNLANAASTSLQIVATVRATGTYANTATVSSTSNDPTPGNNTSTSTPTPVASADLSIVKGVSNSTPVVGTNVTFTLTVTNNGPSAAAAVSVADLLPDGYTYVSDNGAGAYVPGTGAWTIGALANGASTSLQIVATVRAAGPYANTATVSSTTNDPTPSNNTSTSTPVPVASADLSIVKGVSNSTPVVGSNVTFTLTVTNNGPSAAAAVAVADLLPSGYTYVSDNGAGAYVPGTGVWTIGTLANAASASLQITATVNPAGTYANTATVSSTTGDPTPGNNTSTSTPAPVASTDVAVSKAGPANVNQGGIVTYQIYVWNNGPSVATGASITDTVPANLTGVSWTCAGTGAGATCGTPSGTGNNISLSANLPLDTGVASEPNSVFVTVTVTGTATTPGTITNTATVAPPPGSNDANPGNNSSSASTDIAAQADLSITKGVSNAAPIIGTNVVFTLTVTNNGPSAAAAVAVADLLPSGYTYVSDNGAGAYVPGTGVWTIGTLANAASASLQITATVNPAGTYANTATVSSTTGDPTPGNNTSTSTPVPVASADLVMAKSVDNASPVVGANVVFTLTVTNNGPSAAAAVSVADLLPSGYTYVSDNGAGAYVSGTGVWTIGSLANGASASLQIAATVNATGTYLNSATVSSTTNDPTTGNNTDTETTTPTASADLAIRKTGPATVNQGDSVSYTIQVWNNGLSDIANATVEDTVPTNLTSVSWTCVGTGGAVCVSPSGTGDLNTNVDLPVDTGAASSADTRYVTFTVTGTATTPGAITNTATVAVPAGAIDPTPGNDSSSASTTIVAQADLAIVKGVSNATPVVGSNVVFTLTVTNNGPSAAAAVSVADLLPNGYTYVSDDGAGAYVPGTGVWTIGNLADAASVSLQITATVNATGTYANTATVSSTTTDPTPGNNTSTSTPTPVASADLAIVKGVSNANPNVGDSVTFTLTVTNNGPSAAASASVTDLLPAGYTYVSDDSAGAYVPGTGAWTIGNLANGASVALNIVVTVNAAGPYANTATVTSATNDPTPGNNTSTSTPGPVPTADLAIVKGVSNANPVVGTNVVFTLTVTNNGPSPATAVSVADLLPNGYTYVSDNGAGAYVSGTGVWTIGSLANAASTSLQITATVNATGTYLNSATVSSTTNDPTPTNNTGTATTTPVASADLVMAKSVDNATPTVGTNVVFTLTVTNNGPSASAGVSVADLLPNGYTYVSDNGAGAYVSGTGVWTIGNLANGASTSLQITATVNATGTYANTATVTSTTNDPTTTNNTGTA
ncbi:CARDB domain-containing protein, partial [Lysobacter sp. cf310]|uniref:CARDB domain-containing protein n=1 Tax=Lysobacter sp. cf310 TaxID=1761790 RepID=UPI0008E21669